MSSSAAAERAATLLRLRRPAEAERALREALAAEPHDAHMLTLLSQALLQQDRDQEALDAVRQALAQEPDSVFALSVLAAAEAALGHFVAALDAVNSALGIEPEQAWLHEQAGRILLIQGHVEAALPALERARALEPRRADTMALLGGVYFDLKRYDDAERTVVEALRLDPEEPDAHRVRGLLQIRSGHSAGAVDSQRTALRLDPTDPTNREQLALALKASNPLYGRLLRFHFWLERQPDITRWLIMLSPFIAIRLLRPFEDFLVAQVLLALVFLGVVVTWTIEPMMNLTLLSRASSRTLLPRKARNAALLFAAYVTAGFVALVSGLATDVDEVLGLALGLGILAVSTGSAHLVRPRLVKLMWAGQAIAFGLAVVATFAIVLGLAQAAPLVVALVGIACVLVILSAFQ